MLVGAGILGDEGVCSRGCFVRELSRETVDIDGERLGLDAKRVRLFRIREADVDDLL